MSSGAPVNIYEAVIADLESKIATMQMTVDNLRALSGSSLSAALPSVQAAGTGVSFPTDAFFGMTIADGAKKYLAGIKRTATAKAVSEALIAGGMKSSAKSPVENVRSILSRNTLFVLINGEFGLSEWYPGRKNTGKKPAGQAAVADAEPTPEQIDEVIAQVSSEPVQPLGR